MNSRETSRPGPWTSGEPHYWALLLAATLPLALALHATPVARAADPQEYRIPLQDGRYYDPSYAAAVLFPAQPKQSDMPNHAELSRGTKTALVILSTAFPDVINVQFESDYLVLRIADSDDPHVRERVRRRLAKAFSTTEVGRVMKPEQLHPRRHAVLLIHGLEASHHDLQPLAHAFRTWGVQVLLYDYPNDESIRISGRQLRSQLIDLERQHPGLRLAVVAHSMGGLVARYALESASPSPPVVTDLFTLGTPHQGSQLAIGQPWLEVIMEPDWMQILNPLSDMQDGRGEAAAELLPGSSFLRELNSKPHPRAVRYHVAAGRRGLLSAARRQEIRRKYPPRTSPDGDEFDLPRLLAAPEFQTGRGDGAVALESALLPGADTQRVFDLNHVGLIRPDVKDVEDSEVFRWIVDTLGWSHSHARQ